MGDLGGRAKALLYLSMVLALVAGVHAAEDFQYREFAWLGARQWLPGLGLATAYAAQIAGAFALGEGRRAGPITLGVVGMVWCLGAVIVHGREILAGGEYRHGITSKALEVAVIILGAAVAYLGLRRGPAQDPSHPVVS
jgi:hypothetical protein